VVVSCERKSGKVEFYFFLDSHFRGKDTHQPASASPEPASPARGEAVLYSAKVLQKKYFQPPYREAKLGPCQTDVVWQSCPWNVGRENWVPLSGMIRNEGVFR